MSSQPKKVNVFVYNNCSKDARVLKEAASLTKAGFEVKIVAVLDNVTIPLEKRNGFEIHRIKRESLHVRVISFFRKIFNAIRFVLLFPLRLLIRILTFLIKLVYDPSTSTTDNESSMEEDSKFDRMSRILRNPHFYTVKDYLYVFGIEKSRKEHVITIFLAIIGLPFYIVGRAVAKVFHVFQVWFFGLIKSTLMPYHRNSVFEDYYEKAALFCEEFPADILHFHDLHTLPIIGYLKSPEKVKMVYDSHELYTEIHTLNADQKKKYTKIESEQIHVVDHVITVNKSIARELSERYGVKEPTIVMNCPPAMLKVPEKSALLRNKAGIKSDELVILYQGGYSTGRGLEELILSMKYVKNGSLVMMGWGPIEDDLRALASKNGLASKIKFIPPAEQHEVLKYTCGADLGIIPYRAIGLNNYYTSPNKLFEYIQAYVPVAGSDFPELKRIIEGHEIGGLFNPDDPESIGNCINILLSDKEELARLRNNVITTSELYSWEVEEKKLVSIYQNLIQN
ncbi:MAG: glycosyltransferase family 4 protein [Salibacteraceae bacterium]|jgi:glycosyltransferase involved in cell wall biosynthesis|nr:glycosyltransferase family 4 protein [Salibacteraceae bacterium]MDP4763729.1 glycosyltransferase family 4 protein [Salibacteraceae bacterium]MDP4844040.1 glycosyltransferase family 4 protein [Salibacteraceae bacterium]MDP4965405.1 glycosyltransferase family 4 protein [Salibacteraceae bacterium]